MSENSNRDVTGGSRRKNATRRLSRRRTLAGLGTLGPTGLGVPAVSANPGNGNGNGQPDGNVRGTPVLDWSEMALDTVIESGIVIPDSGRLYAIVHVAMHDAVNGINQVRGDGFEAREQIIVDETPAVPGASRVAAVATAARETVEATITDYLDDDAEVLDDLRDEYEQLLEEHIENDTDGNTRAGIEWGERVAEAVRDARADSGFFEDDDLGSLETYDTEDLAVGQAQAAASWGNSNLAELDPWRLDAPDEIRTTVIDDYEQTLAPPTLDSVQWAVDYNKTKLLGDIQDIDIDEELERETFELTWDEDDAEDIEGDLGDVVDWIEGRDTEVSARGFDNESVEVLDEDDGTPTKIELAFTRPAGFDELGNFWVALSGTAQPDGRWIQIAHVLSEEKDVGFTRNAWLLADIAIAAIDGAITSWNTKRAYAIKDDSISWRPHAPIDSDEKRGDIQDDDPPTAADDGNPLTETDSDWEAISGHAASGEHPSGLTLASTAAQFILDDYFPEYDEDSDEFDEDETFEVTVLASGEGAEEGETTTEEFASFEEARRIAMDTREYTGRHYRYSLEASATMGQRVAERILDDG